MTNPDKMNNSRRDRVGVTMTETWHISENPPDGLNPFRFRLLGGEGRETRLIAMFIHLTDIEKVVADHASAEKLKRWEEAMTDVSVVNWTLAEDNAKDLHKQLMAVIAETVQIQLDPVVSKQAAKLRQTSEQLTEALFQRDSAWKEHRTVHDKLRETEEKWSSNVER